LGFIYYLGDGYDMKTKQVENRIKTKKSHLINGVVIGALVFAIFMVAMTSSISETQAAKKEEGKKLKLPSCTETGDSKCCLHPDGVKCEAKPDPVAPLELPPKK
jgi:hypothetical protein